MNNDERETESERGRRGSSAFGGLPVLAADGRSGASMEGVQSQVQEVFPLAPYRRRPRAARPPKVIVAGGLDEARAYVPPTAVPDSAVPRVDVDEDTPRVLIHEPQPPSSRATRRDVTWLALRAPGPTSERRPLAVPPSSRPVMTAPPSSSRQAIPAPPPSSRQVSVAPPASERLRMSALPARSLDFDAYETQRPTVLAAEAPRPDVRWIGVIAGVAATVMLTTWLVGTALVRPTELPPPMASKGVAAALSAPPAPTAETAPPAPPAPPEKVIEEAPQAVETRAPSAPPRAPSPRRASPKPQPALTASPPQPSTPAPDLPNYE